MQIENKELVLSNSEYTRNAIRAVVKGLPWIGSSLEQLIYGNIDERRWQRIERTLVELDEQMKKNNIPPESIQKEEFGQLLRMIAPNLSESVNEEKRQRFRDLLINAVTIPEGDSDWESARLAAEYINKLEGPGFEILAMLAKGDAYEDRFCTVDRDPKPRILSSSNRNELNNMLQQVGHVGNINNDKFYYPLKYEWAVVEEWLSRLVELQLIEGRMHHQKHRWVNVLLTAKGSFLVHWVIASE